MLDKQKDIKLYWEIVVPEPFIIDSTISDDQFLSKFISMINKMELSEFLQAFLQKPTKFFIIHCKESEVKSYFQKSFPNVKSKLERTKYGFMIKILSNDNELIGRGEITKLGKFLPKNKIINYFEKEMLGFNDNYKAGSLRLKRLVAQIELLKSKFNSKSNMLS